MMNKTIVINIVADAMGILADDSLEGNLYLFDNNRSGGSKGEGTSSLQCMVCYDWESGDKGALSECRILWNITNLCPDIRVDLSDLQMSGDAFHVEKNFYEDTDIPYWAGRVCHAFDTETCRFTIRIGSYAKEFTHTFQFKGKYKEEQ